MPDKKGRTAQRLSVAIVGAGRLGTALARALEGCGHEVKALVASRQSSARRAARTIATNSLTLSVAQLAQIPKVDLMLLTTPDDALPQTAARLVASGIEVKRGAVALHASGALRSDVLGPLRALGFSVGSMHPLVSVSNQSSAEVLRAAFYCLEGERRAVRLARRLVRDIGGRSFHITTDKKALYHAAAVMTSGHTVALFDTAAHLLMHCGLNETKAREVLIPLLRSTVENLSSQTPSRALTGTFARADAQTVRRHLDAFQTETEEARAVYVLLGLVSVRLAKEAGADRKALKEIAKILVETNKRRSIKHGQNKRR